MSKQTRFTLFLMLEATEAWLRLPRDERRHLSDTHVGGALQRFPALRLRYFDAEAFTADCSDVMLIEADDLTAHYDFMEMLRDSPMLTVPYFRIVRIIPAIEDGFRAFEERTS
jgi:chlorite dismutase